MRVNRIEYIDGAKAIGIILMILGHQNVACIPYLGVSIYSFHMPLFFIVSGMFLQPRGFSAAAIRYGKNLLVPYYLTCAIAFVAVIITSLWIEPRDCDWILTYIKRVGYGSGSFNSRYLSDVPIIGPIWFLWSMFWGCVAWSYITDKFAGIRRWLMIFLIAFVAVVSSRVVQLPLCVQSGGLAVLYLEIGNWAYKNNVIEKLSGELKWFIWAFAVYALWRVFRGGMYCCGTLMLGGVLEFVFSIMAPLVLFALMFRFEIRDFVDWEDTH